MDSAVYRDSTLIEQTHDQQQENIIYQAGGGGQWMPLGIVHHSGKKIKRKKSSSDHKDSLTNDKQPQQQQKKEEQDRSQVSGQRRYMSATARKNYSKSVSLICEKSKSDLSEEKAIIAAYPIDQEESRSSATRMWEEQERRRAVRERLEETFQQRSCWRPGPPPECSPPPPPESKTSFVKKLALREIKGRVISNEKLAKIVNKNSQLLSSSSLKKPFPNVPSDVLSSSAKKSSIRKTEATFSSPSASFVQPFYKNSIQDILEFEGVLNDRRNVPLRLKEERSQKQQIFNLNMLQLLESSSKSKTRTLSSTERSVTNAQKQLLSQKKGRETTMTKNITEQSKRRLPSCSERQSSTSVKRKVLLKVIGDNSWSIRTDQLPTTQRKLLEDSQRFNSSINIATVGNSSQTQKQKQLQQGASHPPGQQINQRAITQQYQHELELFPARLNQDNREDHTKRVSSLASIKRRVFSVNVEGTTPQPTKLTPNKRDSVDLRSRNLNDNLPTASQSKLIKRMLQSKHKVLSPKKVPTFNDTSESFFRLQDYYLQKYSERDSSTTRLSHQIQLKPDINKERQRSKTVERDTRIAAAAAEAAVAHREEIISAFQSEPWEEQIQSSSSLVLRREKTSQF